MEEKEINKEINSELAQEEKDRTGMNADEKENDSHRRIAVIFNWE